MTLLLHRKWRYWKQDQRPDATPRPSGETTDQKLLFPKIHLLLLIRKSPPPTGYIAYLLFESFFPFVLSYVALLQVSVGADFWVHKSSFYSSHLKNNFVPFVCFAFWWEAVSSTAWVGWLLPSAKRVPHSLYIHFKKEPSSLQSKTRSKLGRVKGRTQYKRSKHIPCHQPHKAVLVVHVMLCGHFSKVLPTQCKSHTLCLLTAPCRKLSSHLLSLCVQLLSSMMI